MENPMQAVDESDVSGEKLSSILNGLDLHEIDGKLLANKEKLLTALNPSTKSDVTDKKTPSLIKIDRALFSTKCGWVIEFKVLILAQDLDIDVDFEFNLLEDTVHFIVGDLICEVQQKYPLVFETKHRENLNKILTREVERMTKERERIQKQELIHKAQNLYAEKKFEEARFCYQTLLDILPMDSNKKEEVQLRETILFNLGTIELRSENLTDAKNLFEQQLALDKKHPEWTDKKMCTQSQIHITRSLIEEEQYKKAETILKTIMDQEEGTDLMELCRSTLVKCYEKQNKLFEAEALYKREWDEKYAAYQKLETKAAETISQGNLEAAQQLFKDALVLKEQALPILQAVAKIYAKHNKFTDALQYYKLTLELKDQEHYSIAEVMCNIAEVHILQNHLDEAEKTLTSALKICEKALHSNENLLQTYASKGSSEQVDKINARVLEIKKILLSTISNLLSLYDDPSKEKEFNALKKKLMDISASIQQS